MTATKRSITVRAPYGKEELVALERRHRVLLSAGATPAFCRKLGAMTVTVGEFVAAARDYPIVFTGAEGGRGITPVIVLALGGDANLFVDRGGEWDASAYVPAYVRRFPFCLSSERMVCVVKSYIDKGGVALHDKAGKPNAQWQAMEKLLAQFDADLDRTAQFCTALMRLDLLQPFTAESKQLEARVEGMARVSEAKLRGLPPIQLKALAEKGWLGLIYAHLHSLAAFERLAARFKARKAAGKGSRPSRRSRPK